MKTRRERLIALRDRVIKKLPLRNRSRVWVEGQKPVGWGQTTWYDRRADHPCGTTACIAGAAGLLPDFRKAGLRTDKRGGVTAKFGTHLIKRDRFGNELTSLGIGPGHWFGLTDEEASLLFFNGSFASILHVKEGSREHRDILVNRVNRLIEDSPK